MTDSLQQLVNRAIFLSTETQSRFGQLIADADWDVEFTDDPRLTFTGDTPLALRAHLIGSASSGDGTWHWGWDNPNGFPEPVVALSHAIRRMGAERGIDELTIDEVAADDELPLRLTLAAKALTGRWAHYPAEAGGGTVVWMIVEADELDLGEPTIRGLVRSLAQGLTATTVTDHVEALRAYAEARGFPLAMLPDGGLRILASDGSADVTFDELNRITNCQVSAPLEGEAAEQFADAEAPVVPGPMEIPGIPAGRVGTAPEAPVAAGSAAPAEVESQVPAGSAPEAPAEAEPEAPAQADSEAPADAEQPQPDAGTEVGSKKEAEATTAYASAAPSDAEPEPADEAEPTSGTEPADTESAGTEPSGSESTAPADAPAPDRTEETDESAEPKKKKKGLFSRLFGR